MAMKSCFRGLRGVNISLAHLSWISEAVCDSLFMLEI